MDTKTHARFMRKVEVQEGENGCWNWTGSGSNSGGYGRFGIKNKTTLAHRLSYEHHKGAITPGLLIRHSDFCNGNKLCVNPAHLSIGTPSDNMQDREKQGRANHRYGKRPRFAILEDRFKANVKVEPCGCHSFGTSKIVNRYAYFRITSSITRKTYMGSHVAYCFSKGLDPTMTSLLVMYNLSKGLDPNTPPPEELAMRHSCDNCWCVNPEHLTPGTITENMKDKEERERGNRDNSAKGQTHYRAKLNDDKVREIRILFASGISQPKIAKRFGVARATIRDIHTGKTWKHVK